MRALERLFIWILILAIWGGAVWYFLFYNPALTAGFLTDWGASAFAKGNTDWSIRCYRWANALQKEDQEISLTLAQVYKSQGNYTKTEYTLVNAISHGGDEAVYRELCKVYVEQDKLLDAVEMLDHIADPAIHDALNAQRPAAPTTDVEPGIYNQYMTVTLDGQGGTVYMAAGEDYPTMDVPYEEPISLNLGENTISALSVGENGLVSPLAVFGYTIGGVVETVELEDPALDAYVRELLGRSSSYDLTTADLWSMEEMTIPGEVSDFSQMGYFSGLLRLTIEGRNGLDISFLSQMPKLASLDLSGCALDPQQLSHIAGLSYLQELNISGCSLSTVAGLSGMTSLVTLDASVNSISDLSPLMGNTGLTTLNLQHNAVSSFGALADQESLLWLNLSHNSLNDFAAVTTCKNLSWLDVSNNVLVNLSGISKLTKLEELDASYNDLADTTGIGSCAALQKVNLSNNVLTLMDELVVLPNLTDLDVSYNDIVVIPDFSDDAKLASFNGCHNFFEDVSGLAGLLSLNYVYLDYNNITDINVLSGCYNLIQVNVFSTNVEDVSALLDMDVIISYNPT